MTNFYTIQTIEFHKEALAFAKECAAKRTEDVGLSVWTGSTTIGSYRLVIEAPRAAVHNDDCDRYGGAENY